MSPGAEVTNWFSGLLMHTADLHIGAFARTPLYRAGLDALKTIAEEASIRGAEALIIAGDLFETPRIENYELLTGTVKTLRSLVAEGIPVVVVPGSHDSSPTGRGSLELLREAGLLHIPPHRFDSKGLHLYPLEVGGYRFYALPGMKNGLEVEYLKEGMVVLEDYREGEDTIILAHTSVKFAGYDPSAYSRRYGWLSIAGDEALRNLPPADYVALGHIHLPLPRVDEFSGNIAYPGAPVGRDANDILETYLLRREGYDRRILLVEPGRGSSHVKSIRNGFGVEVEKLDAGIGDPSDIAREALRIARDMKGEYRCLIVSVANIKPEARARLSKELHRIAAETGVWLHLRMTSISEDEMTLVIDRLREELADVSAIEAEAIRIASEKMGRDPGIIAELLRTLSRERGPDTRVEDHFSSLVEEVLDILGGRGDGGSG